MLEKDKMALAYTGYHTVGIPWLCTILYKLFYG